MLTWSLMPSIAWHWKPDDPLISLDPVQRIGWFADG